ncbi:MAG: hypothetical protein Q9165_008633 [Trypethelium subeluteriae]
MNAWPQDSNGIYPNAPDPNANFDPSMSSMFTPTGFDGNPYQNAQRMQNGNGRGPSPAFPNSGYQVNPVIPSKRPHPGGDNMGGSPAPGHPNPNISRSQTPQQMPYQNFGGQPGGQNFQTPNPYQHLQQTASSNATPSPTMPNQQFRPPAVPQRMPTASPHQFPTSQPNFGGQMSPPPTDQNSRMGTPQNSHGQNMMGGMGMGQGYNPMGMSPANVMGMPAQSVALTDNLQQRQAEMQRQYQMRLQSMQHGVQQFGGQQRQQNGGPNPMAGAQGGPPSQGMPGGSRPGFPQQGAPVNDQVLRSITSYMQTQGLPFNPHPTVSGRPVNIASLFGTVIKLGGSQRITMANQWPMLVQTLGFLPQQFPTAVHEIQAYWQRNLASYEKFYITQKKRQAQVQQMGMMSNGVPQMSPTKMMQPGAQEQAQQYMQSQMQQQRNQAGPPTPRNASGDMNTANGSATPQPGMQPNRQQNVLQHQRMGSAAPSDTGTSTEQHQAVPPTPAKVTKVRGGPPTPPGDKQITTRLKYKPESSTYLPKHRTLDPGMYGAYDLEHLISLGTKLAYAMPNIPTVEEMGVIDIRALIMSLQCGIHAEVRLALDHLVMLSHEQRLPTGGLELERCEDLVDALVDCAEEQIDYLAEDASEVSDAVDLSSYEDLVRGCLTENATLQDVPEFGTDGFELDRASDRLIAVSTILRNLSFNPANHKYLCYNPLIKFISNTIRLLGTRYLILRSSTNTQDFMKDIVTFFSNTAQEISLPSQADAHHILRFLLAFAPCPPPVITTSPSGVASVRFAPYQPTAHRYLPHAVDTLAKLLARDDPNRAHFKALFAAEAANPTSSSLISTNGASDLTHAHPYDLLTRTFALAIAPLPERARGLSSQAELRIADARKPYLTQGMLAADILACLIPPTSASSTQSDSSIALNGGPVNNHNSHSGSGNSHGNGTATTNHASTTTTPVLASPSSLARAWLESEDGWAPSLLRLVCVLSTDQSVVQANAAAGRPLTEAAAPQGGGGGSGGRGGRQGHHAQQQQQQPQPRIDHEASGFGLVTHRALGMLRRLAEMAGVDEEVGFRWDEVFEEEEEVEEGGEGEREGRREEEGANADATAATEETSTNGVTVGGIEDDAEKQQAESQNVVVRSIEDPAAATSASPSSSKAPDIPVTNGDITAPIVPPPQAANGNTSQHPSPSERPRRKSRPFSRTAAIATAFGGLGASKADVLPKREMLLGALLTPDIDAVALRGLCSLASLER